MGKGIRAWREHVPEWHRNIGKVCSWRLGLSPTSANRKYIWSWMPNGVETFAKCLFMWQIFGGPHLMLSIGLAGFAALPERFFPFPSLLNYRSCFGWCSCCGPSLKVVPSDSMTVNLNWSSYFFKSQNCLWLLDLLLRSEFPSKTKFRHNIRTLLSLELLDNHCVLILRFLYSSTMDLSGSLNRALLLQRAIDDIDGGIDWFSSPLPPSTAIQFRVWWVARAASEREWIAKARLWICPEEAF